MNHHRAINFIVFLSSALLSLLKSYGLMGKILPKYMYNYIPHMYEII